MTARDPGLQPERTALAWQRTGLAAAAVGLVLGLAGLRVGEPIVAVLAAATTVATLALAVFGFPHPSGRTDASLSAWSLLVRIALIVAGIAAIGILLAARSLVEG